MPELRAMPLWVEAYLADTSHLSDAEHGRYFQILMALWLAPDQRLPNDDFWLARKFRRSVEEVRAELRPIIAEFCRSDGNWISQDRLSREWSLAVDRSRRGSGSAKSRWEKEKARRSGNADTQAFSNASERKGKNNPLTPSGEGEPVDNSTGAEVEGATPRARGDNPRAVDLAANHARSRAERMHRWLANLETYRTTGLWSWGPKPDLSQSDPLWQTGNLLPREFLPRFREVEEELAGWRAIVAQWAAGAPWPGGRGDPPDHPATRVPGEITRKLAGVLKQRTAKATV